MEAEQSAEPEQFVGVAFPYKIENNRMQIMIDVQRDRQEVTLCANKDAMAYLASLATDFLVFGNPSQLAYSIGVTHGFVLDSPTLELEFDATLDEI